MTRSRAAFGLSLLTMTIGLAAACAAPPRSQPGGPRASAPLQPSAAGYDSASPRLAWSAPPAPGASTLPAQPTTAGTPRWAASPPGTELYTAIEGVCPHLGVSQPEGATLVHYGPGGTPLVAKLTDDGVEPVPFTLAPPDDLAYGADTYDGIRIHGRWPDASWVSYESGSRCAMSLRVRRIEGGVWKPAFLKASSSVLSSSSYGTGLIGLQHCMCPTDEQIEPGCLHFFVSDGVKPPPMTGDGFSVGAYATLPTGEVYAIGQVCRRGGDMLSDPTSCSGQFRWFTPGAKLGWDVVNATGGYGGTVLVRSKIEVFALQGDYIGLFDGKAVKKLDGPVKDPRALYDAGADGVWIRGEKRIVRRKNDGTYEDVALPPGGVSELVGVKSGAVWAINKGGVYRREASGGWHKVELPRPVFTSSSTSYLTPTSISMSAPDDVTVTASYFELAPGWQVREERVAVLRTKKPKETLRCRYEPDGAGVSRLSSWPAIAGESCTTPLLVLTAVSAQSPPDFDYPQTRAILRPHAERIANAELSELRENGRRYIAVVPRSVADGRTLAELYTKRLPLVHAEVVCAAPTVTRTIPLGK